MLGKIDSSKIDFFKTTVKDRIESLKEEIKQYRTTKKRVSSYLHILTNCLNNKEANILVNELFKHWHKDERTRIDYYKYCDSKELCPDTLKDRVENYKRDIEKIDSKIKILTNNIKKIEALPEDSMVAGWTEDAHDDLFYELMSMLEEDDRVIILERKTD